MEMWTKLGIAGAALGGWLGLSSPPEDDPAREARVAELYARYRADFAAVPEVDATTLGAWLDEGRPVVLVDVRTDAERAVSTLPGAVPAAQVEAHPDAYAGQILVAYCTIGFRSGQWAEEQRAAGLDVLNLSGSLLAWTYTGRPLAGPAGPTKQVHVYGATWDLARSDYAAVW